MSKKTENRQSSVAKSMSNVVLKNVQVSCSDSDFSEALTVTRTLFKDEISKTSIVEASLACACATDKTFTSQKIAAFIVNTLNVKDCFHKREISKNKSELNATTLRVRHHVVDTIKTNHIADQLYSYDKESDSVTFTEKYIKICKTDVTYRKKVSALIQRVKRQYNAATAKTVKTAKKAAKTVLNAEHAALAANAKQTATKAKRAKKSKLNKKNAEHAIFLKTA